MAIVQLVAFALHVSHVFISISVEAADVEAAAVILCENNISVSARDGAKCYLENLFLIYLTGGTA